MLSSGYHGGIDDIRSPLFVRLPASLLTRLDDRIQDEGRTKQAVVEDLIANQLDAPADDEILDLPGVAALLRVDESAVLDRIRDGDFPARRFDDGWRCARSAVLAWLAGTDPVTPRATGFVSSG